MATLTLRQKPKGASNKLTVEDAFGQIRQDLQEIRRRLLITSPILTAKEIPLIEKETANIQDEKKRTYQYYEMAHAFMVDHVMAALKEKIGLDGGEEKLLRAVSGRVFFSPPEREYLIMAEAAESLAAEDERGLEIFKAWRGEYANLLRIVRAANVKTSDMFSNAVAPTSLILINNFSELARRLRQTVAGNEEDGTEPFFS